MDKKKNKPKPLVDNFRERPVINAISIICLVLVLVTFAVAIATDFLVFGKQANLFISGIFNAALAFFFGIVTLVGSCMLLFGLVIWSNVGFWPAQWAHDVFYGALKGNEFKSDQLTLFLNLRYTYLTIFVVVFLTSFVCSIILWKSFKHNIKKRLAANIWLSIIGGLICVSFLYIIVNI